MKWFSRREEEAQPKQEHPRHYPDDDTEECVHPVRFELDGLDAEDVYECIRANGNNGSFRLVKRQAHQMF